MLEFLKEDSIFSSTRLVLILMTMCVMTLSAGMLFYIIWNTIKGIPVEWTGVTLFLGGNSAMLGTVMYGKVKQKGIELGNKEKIINKNSDT
ncbi:MAG: hypothetical protein HRT87_09810 [Legionellales bacterium]|nr:hypothetical protein [Legionellales bacterium]